VFKKENGNAIHRENIWTVLNKSIWAY